MPTYRQIEYPVRLSTAELRFFLSFLYHHNQLPGAHNATLFPDDPAAQEALVQQGAREAEANGWFDPNADGEGNAWLDERILLLVACLVDPHVTIESVVERKGEAPAQINHFIATDMVVEMTLEPGDRYALSELESLETMTGRLANVYDIAAHDEREATLSLTPEQIGAARRTPEPALIERFGAAPDAAAWLAATFAAPIRYGTMTLYQVIAGEAVAASQIGVVVGADGTSWIGQPVGDALHYRLVDEARFEAAIAAIVAEFYEAAEPVTG